MWSIDADAVVVGAHWIHILTWTIEPDPKRRRRRIIGPGDEKREWTPGYTRELNYAS